MTSDPASSPEVREGHEAPSGAIVVLVTAPVDAASALADLLLERRLIACANLIGPIESRFLWDGRLEIGAETLLVMKSTAELFEPLRAEIRARHPYEVPEILELPVGRGEPAYLDWIFRCCRQNRTEPGTQVDTETGR